jgi:hypothetical protein
MIAARHEELRLFHSYSFIIPWPYRLGRCDDDRRIGDARRWGIWRKVAE